MSDPGGEKAKQCSVGYSRRRRMAKMAAAPAPKE